MCVGSVNIINMQHKHIRPTEKISFLVFSVINRFRSVVGITEWLLWSMVYGVVVIARVRSHLVLVHYILSSTSFFYFIFVFFFAVIFVYGPA